jgi:hypothetical protein
LKISAQRQKRTNCCATDIVKSSLAVNVLTRWSLGCSTADDNAREGQTTTAEFNGIFENGGGELRLKIGAKRGPVRSLAFSAT